MFREFSHNVTISLRLLTRNKVYTTINLAGLVLGLTVSFILLIFAINEVSFNKCYTNAGRIYRVINRDNSGNQLAIGPYVLKPLLLSYFPEIEKSARLVNLNYSLGEVTINRSGVYRSIQGFFCADQEVTGILEMKIIRGSQHHFMRHPHDVIISNNSAHKYFPSASPIGKSIEVKINNQLYSLTVSGVFQDLPWNSTFQADIIATPGFCKEVMRQIYPDPEAELASINDYSFETMVLLRKNAHIGALESRLPAFCKAIKFDQGSFSFQNFRDTYLHSGNIQNDFIAKGSTQNLFVYLSLSLFILILASVNYSMLSAARSTLRFKEIGVRKVLGASGRNLRNQLLTESVLLTLVAFPLSLLLLGLIDPVVEQYFGYRIHLDSTSLLPYLFISATLSVLIGLVSGLYVALYLSSLDPVIALKSNYIIYKKVSLSKIFIVFQILITLVLFIGLVHVYLQIRLCFTNEQGINQQNLLIASFNPDENRIYRLIKHDVQQGRFVSSVTGASIQIPANDSRKVTIAMPNRKEGYEFEVLTVDYNFFETLGAKFVSGGDFRPGDPANAKSAVINEEGARLIGYQPLTNNQISRYKIIGVVRDFNIHSLYKKIAPTLFKLQPEACNNMIIKYKSGNESELLDIMNKRWNSIVPDIPLEYKFFDQQLNVLYIKEQNFGRVVGIFTLLAFIITGMGLFGLAMLIVERRMKEMSIRKVFGATPGSIVYLIQKEFIVYILIAALVAIPLAWYFLSLWLGQFYYRIGLHWYMFLFSVVVVGIFVSAILFIKTLRILRENPANALKYE
ncbi:MAG: FtsX-like permease family protein [Bacteroidota bacterium]